MVPIVMQHRHVVCERTTSLLTTTISLFATSPQRRTFNQTGAVPYGLCHRKAKGYGRGCGKWRWCSADVGARKVYKVKDAAHNLCRFLLVLCYNLFQRSSTNQNFGRKKNMDFHMICGTWIQENDQKVLDALKISDKWLSDKELSDITGLPLLKVRHTLALLKKQEQLYEGRKRFLIE